MNLFASPSKSIFRQAALDRLSSPEQIDRLDVLISRRSWAILLGFFIFISLALYWGVYGKVATRVDGSGILLTAGGIITITSPGPGLLTRLPVKPEDQVRKGDVLAQIDQPELRKEIEAARQRLTELYERQKLTRTLQEAEQKAQSELRAKRQATILDSIETLKAQKRWIEERIAQQTQLQAKGLITNQAVLDSQRERQRLEGQMRDYENQLKQLPAEAIEMQNRHVREALGIEAEIAESRRKLDHLEKRSELTTQVLAPEDGRILEVMVAVGDMVQEAKPLMSLEPVATGTGGLEGVFYVALKDGKQIKPGMAVQIVPGSVKREEYGFILGKVLSVSAFPATTQGMMAILGNQTLVQNLTQSGAPLMVRASLDLDPASPSGYRWSSGHGPDLLLTSGTFCSVSVVVREQAPITLVIPTLKQYLGL
ncbi:MAG: Membrane-fusion protein [Candidatus Ozemobacter sibiricus]|jgi:HlyD family secretion protein|uniref:Membrane-fusion protein n=1 Tax=Candidatus Ozemobacter sibiricus TaxID=2268124 RepID=A0A367Z8C1_9BACT|nr:MAG: Membrane-fusion protein [Candidatus Ozemobacter sibiricus]